MEIELKIKPVMKPKAIDLFSGCGGLTLGLTQAGFHVVGAVEIDPLAVETYKANHKRVVIWEKDIRKISAFEVMERLNIWPGELDLLAGCPPCQGFSTMTTLNGRIGQDKQNDLVFQFLRFVRAMHPRAIMLENVPKLARNRRFKTLHVELQRLGYEVNHSVLNAADYGVPQRRRRLILVAGHGKKFHSEKLRARKSPCAMRLPNLAAAPKPTNCTICRKPGATR